MCLGRRFWSVTGHSASQAVQVSQELLPWPPSNPGKLLRKTWSLPVLWPRVNISTPRADLPTSTFSSAEFVHFPQPRPGQQISLSSFTRAPLVIASKALQSTLKQAVKEHEQMGEGQMEIKDDHSDEDKFK